MHKVLILGLFYARIAQEQGVSVSQKLVFITAYVDKKLYHKCVADNPFIRDNPNIENVGYDNTVDNKNISIRYNEFLNSWSYDNEAWFVFCHSDWEVLEDLTLSLANLDKKSIYGPIGAIVRSRRNKLINEYRGYCQEMSRDGSVLRTLNCAKQTTGMLVDTLDAQCMIVHSSLVKKHHLRFDESFEFDLYCEDFSARAKNSYKIPTRILRVECRHNNIIYDMKGRLGYYHQLWLFNHKHPGITLGSTVGVLGMIKKPVEHLFPNFTEIDR